MLSTLRPFTFFLWSRADTREKQLKGKPLQFEGLLVADVKAKHVINCIEMK